MSPLLNYLTAYQPLSFDPSSHFFYDQDTNRHMSLPLSPNIYIHVIRGEMVGAVTTATIWQYHNPFANQNGLHMTLGCSIFLPTEKGPRLCDIGSPTMWLPVSHGLFAEQSRLHMGPEMSYLCANLEGKWSMSAAIHRVNNISSGNKYSFQSVILVPVMN